MVTTVGTAITADSKVVAIIIKHSSLVSQSAISHGMAVFFYTVRYDSCMKAFTSDSLEDTHAIAQEWLASVSNMYSSRDEALVVGLSGHLGAGKTAFVKLVAKELGIEGDITSPTFVLMKNYPITNDQLPMINTSGRIPWKRLVHIDAYRLERREELEALNWEQLVADKNNLILVEWPEQVGLKKFEAGAHLKLEIKEGKHTIVVI